MINIAKKLFIFIIPRLPNSWLNFLIKVSARKVKPIEGNPDIYKERPYTNPLNLNTGKNWREFLIGSVKGIYFVENKSYNIVAIQNTKPKNGHFERAVEWFEKSARQDKYILRFLETNNPKLVQKLLSLGYQQEGNILYKQF